MVGRDLINPNRQSKRSKICYVSVPALTPAIFKNLQANRETGLPSMGLPKILILTKSLKVSLEIVYMNILNKITCSIQPFANVSWVQWKPVSCRSKCDCFVDRLVNEISKECAL